MKQEKFFQIAKYAMLSFDGDRMEQAIGDMRDDLDFADIAGIPCKYAELTLGERQNIYREDIVVPSTPVSELTAEADEVEDGYFVIKKLAL